MVTSKEEADFIDNLNALPEKARSSKETLQYLVTKHYVVLKAAHDRGYSYEELTPFFKKFFHREIRGETLRKYMSRAKAELMNKGDKEKSPSKKAAKPHASPSKHGQLKPSKEELKDRVFSKPDDKIKGKFQNM